MTVRRKQPKNAAGHKPGGVFLRNLLLIAAAALLLRLAVSGELALFNGGRNSVFTPSTLSDPATYMRLAREILNGEFSGPFYYQPFYYAVFLPAAYFVSAGSVWFVIVLQSLLGAATGLFAGLSAGRLFGKRAAYCAATLVAISTPLLLYTPFHQNETLQTFNLTLLFYLALVASTRWSPCRWAAVGAMTAVAILTRGNIWILVPGLAGTLILTGCRTRAGLPRIAGALALYFALTVALQLPFAAYNSRLLGKLTGPSTAADAVLALGNSPEAPAGGRNPGLPAGPMEYPAAYAQMMQKAQSGVPVPRQMFDWLKDEPGAFLELQFRKLLLFWDSREIPNNVSLYGEGGHSAVLRLLLPGRSLILITLGVAGLLIYLKRALRKREAGLLLLYYFTFAYWAAIALFYILSRFRAPVLPFLAIAGGGYLAWALRRFRLTTAPEARRRALLYGGAALLAGFWLTGSSYDFYRANLEAPLHRLVRPNGTRIAGTGTSAELIDHGPFTFGGWSEALLEPGTRFAKEFTVRTDNPVEFELGLLTLTPGHLTFRINGETRVIDATETGLKHIPLKLPALPAGTVDAELIGVTGEHHLLFDAQRNYGRSSYNNAPLAGEWIARLRYDTSTQRN